MTHELLSFIHHYQYFMTHLYAVDTHVNIDIYRYHDIDTPSLNYYHRFVWSAEWGSAVENVSFSFVCFKEKYFLPSFYLTNSVTCDFAVSSNEALFSSAVFFTLSLKCIIICRILFLVGKVKWWKTVPRHKPERIQEFRFLSVIKVWRKTVAFCFVLGQH